jgi:hypothetical protein
MQRKAIMTEFAIGRISEAKSSKVKAESLKAKSRKLMLKAESQRLNAEVKGSSLKTKIEKFRFNKLRDCNSPVANRGLDSFAEK